MSEAVEEKPEEVVEATEEVVEATEEVVEAKPQEPTDRKSTRLNSSHSQQSRMPSSA